jgi:hypothetical protein
MDFKTKKKEIYVPLKKILKEIMKGLKAMDLHIPIAQIARMDVGGAFTDQSLKEFRKTVLDYMEVVNKYRHLYFDFMLNTKKAFDREMTKDGSFAPGLKQYISIQNQIFEALILSNGDAWIMSYDQYLPTIRQHSNKRSKKPRNGKKMYKDLLTFFDTDIKGIKDMQKLSFQISKLFVQDINLAIKNPEQNWQEWLMDDKLSNIKSRSKKY